ncbi:hypothetical protein AB0H34_37130 [Saccharopolyspora shandongensis]|uniref:hypothetical protein n=1 Tax=Saccharopolyspora shandongensis TaxID=418495 RepID=UPI0033D44812
MEGNIIQARGKETVRNDGKSETAARDIPLADWCVHMLMERHVELGADALAFLDDPEESASQPRKIGNLSATRAQDGTLRPSRSLTPKSSEPPAKGGSRLSRPDVRPKGFEPLTF